MPDFPAVCLDHHGFPRAVMRAGVRRKSATPQTLRRKKIKRLLDDEETAPARLLGRAAPGICCLTAVFRIRLNRIARLPPCPQGLAIGFLGGSTPAGAGEPAWRVSRTQANSRTAAIVCGPGRWPRISNRKAFEATRPGRAVRGPPRPMAMPDGTTGVMAPARSNKPLGSIPGDRADCYANADLLRFSVTAV